MRRYNLTWAIVMLVLMFSLVFIAAKPAVTGHSVLDPTKSYNFPVYLSTLFVLMIILLVLIILLMSLGVHASRTRIKEEESIKKLLKNIK